MSARHQTTPTPPTNSLHVLCTNEDVEPTPKYFHSVPSEPAVFRSPPAPAARDLFAQGIPVAVPEWRDSNKSLPVAVPEGSNSYQTPQLHSAINADDSPRYSIDSDLHSSSDSPIAGIFQSDSSPIREVHNQTDQAESCPPISVRDRTCFATAHSCEPELRIAAIIDRTEVNVLVDTGAGWCYAVIPQTEQLGWQTSPCQPFTVELADGSHTVVQEKAVVNVSLLTVTGKVAAVAPVDLFLFRDRTAACSIILGRHGLRLFNIHTAPGVAYIPDVGLLANTNVVPVAAVTELPVSSEPTIDELLQWTVAKGWVPLTRASGYEFRLRLLAADEPKDTDEQTHVFELALPRSRVSGQLDVAELHRDASSAAKGHVRRLEKTLRATSNQLMDEYVKLGFWRETSVAEAMAVSAHRPTPVFLVNPEKPRLVCDFVGVNDMLPKAGNTDLTTSQLLTCVRFVNPAIILVTDVSKAFYKIRLLNSHSEDGLRSDLLWLVAGYTDPSGQVQSRNFLCSRLAFGLSSGPSALVSTMTSLMSYPGAIKAFNGWYIDDLTIAAAHAETAHSDYNLVKTLLPRVGHRLEPSKTYVICHSTCMEDANRLFENVSSSAKLFGSKLWFDDGGLVVTCDNTDKVSALQSLVELKAHSTLSKKTIFQWGGVLSYDLVKEHADLRLLGDCLRSLFGRIKTDTWGELLNLEQLCGDPVFQEALNILIEWANGLLETTDWNQCNHRCCVSTDHAIEIYTDASHSGGAFVIRHGQIAIEEAFRFAGAQCRWHSNRLEAFTLWRSLVCVTDLVSFLKPALPLQVRLFSDNRSAVSWANTGSINVGGKQQRRAMQRLVDEMSLEIREIRKFADIHVVHIAGSRNVEADRLSRLCSSINELLEGGEAQALQGPTLHELVKSADFKIDETSLLYGQVALNDAVDVPDIDRVSAVTDQSSIASCTAADNVSLVRMLVDSVAHIDDTPRLADSWIDLAARESYDIYQLASTIAVMRFALKAWFSRIPSRVNTQADPLVFPETSTHDDILAIARATQKNIARNFLHFDIASEVWFLRDPLPTGDFRMVPYIPASSRGVQSLCIRDAHKRCQHRGPDYTLAEVRDFALEKPTKLAQQIVSQCIPCQIKRAKRATRSHLEMFSAREDAAPFHEIACDHFHIGEKAICLSLLCTCTGFVMLGYCESHSLEHTFKAMRFMLTRLPRRPAVFRSDKGTPFAAVVERLRKYYRCQFTHRECPPQAQHENGLLERLHAGVLSVLRSSLRLGMLDVDRVATASPFEIQGLLDSVSQVLNGRPVATLLLDVHDCSRSVVTPNFLVYGPIGDEILRTNAGPFHKGYNAWRSFYDGYYWKRLKAQSSRAMANRIEPLTPAINELILVYTPQSKSAISWTVAKVLDIRANQLIVEQKGVRKTVSIHNCCRLKLHSLSEFQPFDVRLTGARVVTSYQGEEYLGTVIEDVIDGQVLIRWDVKADQSWPDEWRDWPVT